MDRANVGDGIFIERVFFESFSVFSQCTIQVFRVEKGVSLELDLLRLLPTLDGIKITLEVFRLQLAEHTTVDVARDYLLEVLNCFIEQAHPALGSTSLDKSAGHDLVVEHTITFVLLRLDSFDLLDDVGAIVDSSHVATKFDEACCAIKTSHEELRILLESLSVGIEGGVVVKVLKEVVALVFQPHGISILHIDIHFLLLFLADHLLTFGIGRLLQLTFSGRQVSELLLREARLDGLSLTNFRHLSRSFFDLFNVWLSVLFILILDLVSLWFVI